MAIHLRGINLLRLEALRSRSFKPHFGQSRIGGGFSWRIEVVRKLYYMVSEGTSVWLTPAPASPRGSLPRLRESC